MAGADQVYLLMLNNLFWSITPALPTGTAGTRQPVGTPEHIPDHAFIAGPVTGDTFLEPANAFHRAYNINPVEITSFEQLIDNLNRPQVTSVNRLRIISHADQVNIFVPFFNNDVRGVIEPQLTGFATSDVEGIKSLIRHYSSSSSEYIFPHDQVSMFLTFLRTNNPDELQPFGLQDAVSSPSVVQQDFFRRCIDIWFVNNANITIQTQNAAGTVTNSRPANAADEAVFVTSLTHVLDSIGSSLVGNPIPGSSPSATVTQTNVNNLKAAILGVPAGTPAPSGNQRHNLLVSLGAANQAISSGFRAKLNAVRGKFSSSSVIDIRGCNVGTLNSYMDAVRTFFGRTGNLPSVTAPEWFQQFPFNVMTNFNTVPRIDGLVTGGRPTQSITAQHVAHAFTTWRGLIDFDPHFSFFRGLFTGNKIDFMTLNWKTWRTGGTTTGFPVLRMEAKGIEDIVNAANPPISDVIRNLATLVGLASQHLPAAAVMTRLDQLRPHTNTFRNLSQQVNNTAPTPATNWPPLYDACQNLATAITGISGFPAPATNPLVPANASPTKADLLTYLSNIEQHLNTILNADLNTFFTEMNTLLTHANAAVRYFFMAGLPLLMQQRIGSDNQINFQMAIWGNSPIRDHALRSWMKIQWTGTAQQAAAMNTHIDGLTFNWNSIGGFASVARVVEQHGAASRAECSPLPEYQSHIRSRP